MTFAGTLERPLRAIRDRDMPALIETPEFGVAVLRLDYRDTPDDGPRSVRPAC